MRPSCLTSLLAPLLLLIAARSARADACSPVTTSITGVTSVTRVDASSAPLGLESCNEGVPYCVGHADCEGDDAVQIVVAASGASDDLVQVWAGPDDCESSAARVPNSPFGCGMVAAPATLQGNSLTLTVKVRDLLAYTGYTSYPGEAPETACASVSQSSSETVKLTIVAIKPGDAPCGDAAHVSLAVGDGAIDTPSSGEAGAPSVDAGGASAQPAGGGSSGGCGVARGTASGTTGLALAALAAIAGLARRRRRACA